jgi:hypothetical protein
MSGEDLYKWHIFCNDTNSWEYKWDLLENVPTVCPSNTLHNINLNSIHYEELYNNHIQTVKIQEEYISTGGSYRNGGHIMNISSNSNSQITFTHKYPISSLSVCYYTKDENWGDRVSCLVANNTKVGILTANTVSGNCVLNVSNTVMEKIVVGYDCSLKNFAENVYEDLGEVLNKDLVNNQITVENAPTTNFFQYNTYVMLSVYTFKNHYLGGNGYNLAGADKIGASYVPTLTPVTIIYENINGNTNDKKFLFNYGRLY